MKVKSSKEDEEKNSTQRREVKAEGAEDKIRVIFPLERTKGGKIKNNQKLVLVSNSGTLLGIMRGIVVEVPAWVRAFCDNSTLGEFKVFGTRRNECFASNITPTGRYRK